LCLRANVRCSHQRIAVDVCGLRPHSCLNPLQLNSGRRPPRLTLQRTQMITSAIPVVAVSDSTGAEDYYCRALGFTRVSACPAGARAPDPRYVGVARDGVWILLQSYKPERAGHTDAFLWVTDVDAFHAEVSARGAMILPPPTDQAWGTRETGIRDPD